MNNDNIIEQFCTPPYREETDFDKKAFQSEQAFEFAFENRILKCYSLGKGKNVLLVHGWGSRASHLSLIAKYIVNNGFRAIVYDCPAHGDSRRIGSNDMSNMFEYSRALSFIAKKFENIYAVIGHSFGAMASAFTLAGTGLLNDYKFDAEKLILISSPESMQRVINHFCTNINRLDAITEIKEGIEKIFNFKVSDYHLPSVINNIKSRMMIIHDENDSDIPVTIAYTLNSSNDNTKLLITKGYGHQKILASREMLNSIKDFLLE